MSSPAAVELARLIREFRCANHPEVAQWCHCEDLIAPMEYAIDAALGRVALGSASTPVFACPSLAGCYERTDGNLHRWVVYPGGWKCDRCGAVAERVR